MLLDCNLLKFYMGSLIDVDIHTYALIAYWSNMLYIIIGWNNHQVELSVHVLTNVLAVKRTLGIWNWVIFT